MPNLNLGTRTFNPNFGRYELVYHNESGTIYAARLLPYEITASGQNVYTVEWFTIDQTTGALIAPLNAGYPSSLNPIGFKNRFIYGAYVPNTKDGLLVQIGSKHFPIKMVSRLSSAYDLTTVDSSLIIQTAATKLLTAADAFVYKVKLTSGSNLGSSSWIGARLQQANTSSPITGQFAIIRSYEVDAASKTVIICTESNADWLVSAQPNTVFYVKGQAYSTQITIDDHNPFLGNNGDPKIISVNPLDKGLAVYGTSGTRHVWLKSDKLSLRKLSLIQQQSIHTPSSLIDRSVTNKALATNSYVIWFDGCWNICAKRGSQNVQISSTTNPIENALVYLEGIAKYDASYSDDVAVGFFGLGRLRYQHADIPGSEASFGNEAPITWLMTEPCVIQFPQNSAVYFGSCPKPILLTSTTDSRRRIALPAEIPTEFLAYDTKPGISIDNRGESSVIYVADALLPLKNTSSKPDERIIVEYKIDRTPWAAGRYWSGPWAGVIFAPNILQATTLNMFQNSSAHNGTRWASVLEYWNGPIVAFNAGMANSENLAYNADQSLWFDHRFCLSNMSGEIWNYRNSLVSYSKDEKFANYGADGWNFIMTNDSLNANRWKSVPVFINGILRMLNNSANYEAVVLFGRREINTDFTYTSAFTMGNRFKFTVNMYDAKDIDNWADSNNLTHLCVAGKPASMTDTYKYCDGWTEGFRAVWWNGKSWKITAIGGGSEYSETIPRYKGAWGFTDLKLRNTSDSTNLSPTFTLTGDEWFTTSLNSISGNTTADNLVYVAPSGSNTYILGGNSSTDARYRSWVDTTTDYDSNIAIPYIPHICELEITPNTSDNNTILRITGSAAQGFSPYYLRLGAYSLSWFEYNPTNNTTTTVNKTLHGKTWLFNQPNSAMWHNKFQQPKKFEFQWDWEKDVDYKDGRNVRFGIIATDGVYHTDFYTGPQAYEWLSQKERADLYGTIEKGKLNSYFSFLKELRINGIITMPIYGYSEQRNYRIWNSSSPQAMITGDSNECPVLLSNGRAFLINARTEKKLDLKLVSAKVHNQNGPPDNKTIAGRNRTVQLVITNSGAQGFTATSGNVKAYIVDSFGNRAYIASNNSHLSISANTSATWDLNQTQLPIPYNYGMNKVQVEITTDTLDFIVIELAAASGIHIMNYPSLKVINNASETYAIIVNDDANGQIRGVSSVPSDLLDTYKKQKRHTRGHSASWFFKVTSIGDNSYATVADIAIGSGVGSVLEIQNPSSSADKTSYNLASLSATSVSAGDTIDVITSRGAVTGSRSRMKLYIEGYITGLKETIAVAGYNEAGTPLAWTHDLTTLQDQPVFTVSAFQLLQFGSTQQDESFIYAQENAQTYFYATITKQAGSSSIANWSGSLNWNPVLGGSNPNPWISTSIYMTTDSTNISYNANISSVSSINTARDLRFSPAAGTWRDENLAPITTTSIVFNPKPIKFYGAPQVEILSITQLTGSQLRVAARFYTGTANICRARVRVNEKLALITNAFSATSPNDSIDYGYASDAVVNMSGTYRASVAHQGANTLFGEDFGGTYYNPAFEDDSSRWHWRGIPTALGTWHYLTFDIDAKHWAYHGGKTHNYNSHNDGSTSYSSRVYDLGLKEHQGPVRIYLEVERMGAPIGAASTEKNFVFSYKRPKFNALIQVGPAQDYRSINGSFIVPSYTIYAPDNAISTSATVQHADYPVDDFYGWTSVSTPAGSVSNYTITPAVRNGWSGLYFRLYDNYGNINYDFLIRPHDINSDNSNDIPDNNSMPIPIPQDINRTSFAINSGSSTIYASTAHIADKALKDWSLVFRVIQGGGTADYTVSPSATWANRHTSLVGRWVRDYGRITGSYAKVWNFQDEVQQLNSINPAGSTLGFETKDAREYEGIVTNKSGTEITINDTIVANTHGGTLFYNESSAAINFEAINIGDRIGIEGYFNSSDTIVYTNIVRKVYDLDGFRNWGQSTVYDNEIKQYVYEGDSYGWNTVVKKDANFWVQNSGVRYDTFFITYKLPPMAAGHPTRRRTVDRRIRTFIELETWTGEVFVKQFSTIDDGKWHTEIVRDIANTTEQIKQVRIRFYFDNRDLGYTAATRELFDGASSTHGYKFYIANCGFAAQNFEDIPGDANVFLMSYALPVTLDGDDSVLFGIKSNDYANNNPAAQFGNTTYYVQPKDPQGLTLVHEDSVDGVLRAKLTDINVNGETATAVEYRIGYSSNYNLSSPTYLDGGSWRTKASWLSGNYTSEALNEGETYYFFVIARNPNSPLASPTYNPSYQDPVRTTFTTGYITPILTFDSHLSVSIHSWHDGTYLDANRKQWEQGARQKSRASNPSQTTEGLHFKSRWYDGVGDWMPNISASSTNKTANIRLWDVLSSFPVDGWKYSVSYGASTKLDQPVLADAEIITAHGSDEKALTVNFSSAYRGYAYIHIRPYYTNASGVKVLYDPKYTIHLAYYLEYQDGLNPLPGEVVATAAAGVTSDYSAQPAWGTAIYRGSVRPQGAYGISDNSGIYLEDEEGIRWRALCRVVGGSTVITGNFNGSPWTYGGAECSINNLPLLTGLAENTQYEVQVQAYSEGGTIGSPSATWGAPFYTNIRPVNTILSIKPATSTTATVSFTGIPSSERGNGYYELWNFAGNKTVDTIPFDGESTYSVAISMSPAELGSYIIKSYNGDGIALDPYPFKRHVDTSSEYAWRPGVYAYLHTPIPPSAVAMAGYKTTGKYFRVRPSMENVDTISWYNGTLLEHDVNNHYPINNQVEYSIRVYKRLNDTTTFLGYVNPASWGNLTSNYNASWVGLTTLLQQEDVFSQSLDLTAEYGFQINARKSTDIRQVGSNNTLVNAQYEVCDYPNGDQIVYSGWGDITWANTYPKNEDDYEDNLHLFAKWNYSDAPTKTYSEATIFQDVYENFTTLKDLRVSFKALSSETTNPLVYPKEVLDLNILENSTIVMPWAMLILSIIARTKDDQDFASFVVLWANSNFGAADLTKKNSELLAYGGAWQGIGINEKGVSVSDNFARFIPSTTATLRMDQWYHAKLDAYSLLKIALSNGDKTLDQVKKVRLRLAAIASKGGVYNPSRFGINTNWGDTSWKQYDEGQIGVLVRNISIGWTQQIDKLGRVLYDQTAWNGKYLWTVANMGLKYNIAHANYLAGLETGNVPFATAVPKEFIEKQGAWSPAQIWNYDSYVKDLLSDVKGGNSVYDRIRTN